MITSSTPPGAWKLTLARAALCGAATLAGYLAQRRAPGLPPLALAAYLVAYAAGAYDAILDTLSLLKRRVLDVHFLMLVVAAGAACIGHWWEGGALLFLFSLSGALEEYAENRTEREIHALFKQSPHEATRLLPGGEEQRVAIERLEPGMVIRVRPGEQFPVDARVNEGTSAVDESALTGESAPVDKQAGDSVLAGTLNTWGRLDCVVLRPASGSALAKVIKLIREAQESKAPAQRFTDRFGGPYTYFILLLCATMYLVWWRVAGFTAEHAFYRTMTLLVVASPCALVLSIPSAILAGIAAGARRGVLFRGGVAIEKLAVVNRVALDKTGTLTTGYLRVLSIETVPTGREQDALAFAAALGRNSNHPVSQAIAREARTRQIPLPDVTHFQSLNGLGLTGHIAGQPVIPARIGRRTLFDGATWLNHFPVPEPGVTETMIEAGGVCGRILLRDEVRLSSRPLIDSLRRHGLRVTMLSGDRAEAAMSVAHAVGVEDVKSGLDPEAKVRQIQLWTKNGERVAMVGDGINDAPSLAAAAVGVAMGLRGSDAALEQADIVLMQDRLERFYFAYRLSRHANRIIKQNLAVSLGSVLLLMAAAFGGLIPLTVGVVGHEGSTVVVVLNSLRLLFFKDETGREEA